MTRFSEKHAIRKSTHSSGRVIIEFDAQNVVKRSLSNSLDDCETEYYSKGSSFSCRKEFLVGNTFSERQTK